MLTAIFAIYAVGWVVTAWIIGHLNDWTLDLPTLARGFLASALWPIFWAIMLFAAADGAFDVE